MIKKIVFLIVIVWIVWHFFKPDFYGLAKREIKKLEQFIYREATLHNPQGDLLPDQIDDEVKGLVKKWTAKAKDFLKDLKADSVLN